MTSLTSWGFPLQPKLHFDSFTHWLSMVSHGLQRCHTFLDLSGSLKPWRKDPWPLHSCIFHVSNVSITWMDDTVWLPAWDGPSISSTFHMLKQLVSRRKQLFWISPFTRWKISWGESYPDGTLPIVPRKNYWHLLNGANPLNYIPSFLTCLGYNKLISTLFLSKLCGVFFLISFHPICSLSL